MSVDVDNVSFLLKEEVNLKELMNIINRLFGNRCYIKIKNIDKGKLIIDIVDGYGKECSIKFRPNVKYKSYLGYKHGNIILIKFKEGYGVIIDRKISPIRSLSFLTLPEMLKLKKVVRSVEK